MYIFNLMKFTLILGIFMLQEGKLRYNLLHCRESHGESEDQN